MALQFGTDGWRAVIGEEFTFANVERVSQAIACWKIAEWQMAAASGQPTMVVGYDTRFLSDRFAARVAEVLAGNGIQVYLTNSDTPTPAMSYAIQHLGADGGVMITASHNPPRYNGLKVKSALGGSVSSAVCRQIEQHLENQGEIRQMEISHAMRANLVQRFDATPAYHAHLDTLLRRDVISARPDWAVVDAMYGAGRNHIEKWLDHTGWQVKQIRNEMNPGFGGIHPEPIMVNLEALQRAVVDGHFSVGLATDGDADRIGAIDGVGRFIDPHCIFALALRYLVERRGWRGTVVKSVSMTRMIDRMCAAYQIPLIETPVGFNYIADLTETEDVMIGGEESGGITIRGHVPVGDGILLGLLLLEVVADAGVTLAELLDDLQRSVGPTHYARRDLKLAHPINKRQMTTRLSDDAPGRIGEADVERVQNNDGVKYLLRDGSWLLIRPSGTEPVLRVYAEAPEPSSLASLLAFGQTLATQLSSTPT
jgi:phosphomannomutase